MPHVRMFTQTMLLAATQAFCRLDLTTAQDIGCTGSANYAVHWGVFSKG
ncbi:MAG TPA: hypothetical protein VL334_24930 [Anaerolineae bacterium]|nr:hypothetical protein [Anaerolineae bacterium]